MHDGNLCRFRKAKSKNSDTKHFISIEQSESEIEGDIFKEFSFRNVPESFSKVSLEEKEKNKNFKTRELFDRE